MVPQTSAVHVVNIYVCVIHMYVYVYVVSIEWTSELFLRSLDYIGPAHTVRYAKELSDIY